MLSDFERWITPNYLSLPKYTHKKIYTINENNQEQFDNNGTASFWKFQAFKLIIKDDLLRISTTTCSINTSTSTKFFLEQFKHIMEIATESVALPDI